MPVRYINVRSNVEMFSPVVRATGNVAVIGTAPSGTDAVAVAIADMSVANATFGPATLPDPQPGNPGKTKPNSSLTQALSTLFGQSPGPGQVFAIKAAGTSTGAVADPSAALTTAEDLDVQFVVLAATPLDTNTGADTAAIGKLAEHVVRVSERGVEGRERMGVVMLVKGASDPAVVTGKGKLVSDRMVYIAHKSDDDAAAAVAGTIAGYPPHISMLLKQVAISSAPFSATDIDKINQSEDFGNPPKGNGVNWLVDPVLIAGGGVFLGEGYTGNPGGGTKYIDVRRTVDDISFKLKARLIRAIGNLRISRSGLRALTVQLEAVLDPLVGDEVIDGYSIDIPILDLLDADPAALTAAQLQAIQNAQADRIAQILVTVDYAGAIHRIALALNFV
ncbi:hypothetical protein KOI35_42585 [Actinoplanes bogorensis]|uniref:Phage tail sheath protein n=1 Tax=Paractinoplanes bogorensis TaxID=1610840 RepID=A0ABS5Z3D6_9ACTN|nr:hypothetical protein [Actinoplanes bogorensis]MBU2670209.1 hypothetical protein [Actinoplanes bogorensis]